MVCEVVPFPPSQLRADPGGQGGSLGCWPGPLGVLCQPSRWQPLPRGWASRAGSPSLQHGSSRREVRWLRRGSQRIRARSHSFVPSHLSGAGGEGRADPQRPSVRAWDLTCRPASVGKACPCLILCHLCPGPQAVLGKWCPGHCWAGGQRSEGGGSPGDCEQGGKWAQVSECPRAASRTGGHSPRQEAGLSAAWWWGEGLGCWNLISRLDAVLGSE